MAPKGAELERRTEAFGRVLEEDGSTLFYDDVVAHKNKGKRLFSLVCCYYVCFLHYFALFGGLGLNR